MKNILYQRDAKKSLIDGVNKIADAVSITLGPLGKNVAIAIRGQLPQVVHDGVTVAKHVELRNSMDNIGASIIRQACEKTNEKVGDGTTTSIVLARDIVNRGFHSRLNPMLLRKELENALVVVVEEIRKRSKPVETDTDLLNIAMISSQIPEIGMAVAEAANKAGPMGAIDIEESGGLVTKVEHKEGLLVDSGYISPYFITDRSRMVCELENAKVLVTDNDIDNIRVLVPVLEKILEKSEALLIVSNHIGDDALSSFIANKIAHGLKVAIIKSPYHGHRKGEGLEDIALVTGASFISINNNKRIEDIGIEDLGTASRVVCYSDRTLIVGGGGTVESVKEKIDQLTTQADLVKSVYERENIISRRARLAGGVAVIQIGGATDSEIGEKKLRAEDAVRSVVAAREEGIVAGAGMAMYSSRYLLKKLGTVGSTILFHAMGVPANRILANAGKNPRILKHLKDGDGLDVVGGKVVNLMEYGIVDSTKVVVSALLNAVSAATMILTTEVIIGDDTNDS